MLPGSVAENVGACVMLLAPFPPLLLPRVRTQYASLKLLTEQVEELHKAFQAEVRHSEFRAADTEALPGKYSLNASPMLVESVTF